MKKTLISALVLLAAFAHADSPFASRVVASTGLSGDGAYNDPNALLGKPSPWFGGPGGDYLERTKLAAGQYGTDRDGNKLLTRIGTGASVTVAFDHDVVDDPANPYGIDLLVFGNSFFLGNDFASDSTNLNDYLLTGDVFGTGMKISVSPNNVDWYTYDSPLANTLYPTNAYRWDRASASWTDRELDFTKPVDPSLGSSAFAGRSAADAIDLYDGSAGGAGYDLALSGFASIRYVRVDGLPGFANGVLDGFADVQAVPEPATFAVLGLGALALVRRRRR